MALITVTQWKTITNAATVVDITTPSDEDVTAGIDASDIQAEVLEQASDWVQEFATSVGVTLTAANITAAMRRRVAVAASYYAAIRKPEYRNADGKSPFHVDFAIAESELTAWADRNRNISSDTAVTPPGVVTLDEDDASTAWAFGVSVQE